MSSNRNPERVASPEINPLRATYDQLVQLLVEQGDDEPDFTKFLMIGRTSLKESAPYEHMLWPPALAVGDIERRATVVSQIREDDPIIDIKSDALQLTLFVPSKIKKSGALFNISQSLGINVDSVDVAGIKSSRGSLTTLEQGDTEFRTTLETFGIEQ